MLMRPVGGEYKHTYSTNAKTVLEFLNNLWRLRVGRGLSYRPARLHRLLELIPWHRFLCSLKVKKFGLWCNLLECSKNFSVSVGKTQRCNRDV